MKRRACGDSGLELPVLGIGCWSFGGGDYWGPQAQSDVEAVVRCAVEHGCNYFDTAEAYNEGESERSLGMALRGLARDRVIIGTKISPSNTEPEILMAHCEASLRRLQTDYIDLYMVHWPITPHSIRHFTTTPRDTPLVSDAFITLVGLQRQGKIRHIGVSNFGCAKLREALDTGAAVIANELPYSLLTRAIEAEILPECRQRRIGVIGYMTLMQGLLSDSFARSAEVPPQRRRTRHFDSRRPSQCRHGQAGAEAETQEALAAIRHIAHKSGIGMAEISLKWAMANSGINCALCGSRNVRQLEMNLRAADSSLASDVIEELNRVTQPLLDKLGSGFDYFEAPENDRTR